MEFGIEKYAMPILKNGKIVTTDGIDLQNQESIRMRRERENYKYTGMLEADTSK